MFDAEWDRSGTCQFDLRIAQKALIAQQLRQLGNIRRDPSRLQAHLRIHKPVAGLPAEHFAPSGAPAEQTTETNVSSSLQLTVPSPLTIRSPARLALVDPGRLLAQAAPDRLLLLFRPAAPPDPAGLVVPNMQRVAKSQAQLFRLPSSLVPLRRIPLGFSGLVNITGSLAILAAHSFTATIGFRGLSCD